MNTWMVGRAPIGHSILPYADRQIKEEEGYRTLGHKTFFMKARILAGQANIKDNAYGVQDFQWLSKDEIEKLVPKRYWYDICKMIPER
jgi:large subunit ribosomal protein L46